MARMRSKIFVFGLHFTCYSSSVDPALSHLGSRSPPRIGIPRSSFFTCSDPTSLSLKRILPFYAAPVLAVLVDIEAIRRGIFTTIPLRSFIINSINNISHGTSVYRLPCNKWSSRQAHVSFMCSRHRSVSSGCRDMLITSASVQDSRFAESIMLENLRMHVSFLFVALTRTSILHMYSAFSLFIRSLWAKTFGVVGCITMTQSFRTLC